MEKSVLGIIVGVIILLGTLSTITLFMAGRTPAGMPVVPSNQLTLASDQVAVAQLPFEDAVLSATPGDRRVRVRTRIAAGYRLVDIGMARLAVRAPVEQVVAWDRLRRSGEPVDVVVPLGPTAGLVPIGRMAANAGTGAGAPAGDASGSPLDLRLLPNRDTGDGWTAQVGPVEIIIAEDRLRLRGVGPVPVDVPVLGPGRWVVLLDAEGGLQRIERAPSADR